MSVISMWDLFTLEQYGDARDEGLISVRSDESSGCQIYNYTARAMYAPGAWDNPAVRACRGLITTWPGRVVARPWPKFHNLGEPGASKFRADELVHVHDKVDGSLGIVFRHPALGCARVATRGSFDSEQAQFANTLIKGAIPAVRTHILNYITPLVEIVYPENRIVVDYGDAHELVLLGGVRIDHPDREYVTPKEMADLLRWRGPVAQEIMHTCTFADAMAGLRDRPNAEGVVIMSTTRPAMVKVKQADYFALHRARFSRSRRKVWQAMLDGRPVDSMSDHEDWEIGVRDELNRAAWAVCDEVMSEYERLAPACSDRKEFALAIKDNPLRQYLFLLWDGRGTDAYKAVLRANGPGVEAP